MNKILEFQTIKLLQFSFDFFPNLYMTVVPCQLIPFKDFLLKVSKESRNPKPNSKKSRKIFRQVS